ncbi:MAG: hypothetical protein IMZ64_13415, partial [Bacteroidetes bacterium]|nr:hypothetical protein [Bacteroidota bacterium]
IDNIDDAERVAEQLRMSGNEDVARTFLAAYRNSAYIDELSRGEVIETGEIRYVTADGRIVAQGIEVRASGTPDIDLDIPRRTEDTTYRNSLPSETRISERVRVTDSDGRRIAIDDVDRVAVTDIRRIEPDERRVATPDERVVVPDERRTQPDERRIVPPDERRIVPPDERVVPPDERRVIPPDERIVPPDVRRVITPEETYIPPDVRYGVKYPESSRKKWTSPELPPATVVMKLGEPRGAPNGMWYILPPPYEKEYYAPFLPTGVSNNASGKGSAEKTLQIVGNTNGLKKFKEAYKDIGATVLHIYKDGDGEMQAEFAKDIKKAMSKIKSDKEIERYKKQYMKSARPKEYKPKGDTKYTYQRVEKIQPEEVHPELTENTYLGYKILPSQLGGEL